MSEGTRYNVDIVLKVLGAKARSGVDRMARQFQHMAKSRQASERASKRELVTTRKMMAQQQQHMRAVNRMARTTAAFGGGVKGFGHGMRGSFLSSAGVTAKYMATGAAAGAIGGTYKAAKSSLDVNKSFEAGYSSVAATLQLFGRNKDAPQQFAANLRDAKTEFEGLFKIAAKSPATLAETQELYKNMLPGGIVAGASLSTMQGMTENALIAAMINGGDYATTGAQLSRMISGGAGAEQETWRALLSEPIREIGMSTKSRNGAGMMFGKNQKSGKDLTSAFNALDAADRLYLVENALKRLSPVATYIAETYEGLASRAQGSAELLQRTFGQPIFDKIKENLKGMLAKGGALDPDGSTMKKLNEGADAGGRGIAYVVDKVMKKAEEGIIKIADNWEIIANRLLIAFDMGYRAAALFLKIQVARGVIGNSIGAIGGAVSMAGKGMSGLTNSAQAMGQLGASAASIARIGLIAAPILAVLAAAVGGLAVAGSGVVIYFIENWDKLVQGIYNGTIVLDPLFNKIDLFWAKMVAVGAVFMGTTNIVDGTNSVIDTLVVGLNHVMAAFSSMLTIAGYVDQALSIINIAFLGLITGLIGLAKIVAMVVAIADPTHSMSETIEAWGLEDAEKWATREYGYSVENLKNNDFHKAAKAFDETISNGGPGITSGIRGVMEADPWTRAAKKNQDDVARITAEAQQKAIEKKMGKGTAKNVTNIHKVIVNQDLRNHDPDRIVGAFYQALDKATVKRTAAFTQLPGGK